MKKIELNRLRGLFLQGDRKKIILLVVMILLFLVFDLYFILGTQIKIIKRINIKINKLKTDLNSFKKDLILMQDSLKGKKEITYRHIYESEISWLIDEISNLAIKNKIEISQIRPQKESNPKFSSPGFIPYLFQLNLNSNYQSLLEFIKTLEQHQVVIGIEELRINQNPNDIFRHTVNLVLRVYVKK